jgi:hypothetical protein
VLISRAALSHAEAHSLKVEAPTQFVLITCGSGQLPSMTEGDVVVMTPMPYASQSSAAHLERIS